MTIYQRSSTPRLAPRMVLKSTWHEQQQQAATNVFSEASKLAIKKWQNRPVRTWRNSQNNFVSCVLATFKRRDSLLRCGMCRMPSSEQSERSRKRIDIISEPLYVVRQEYVENAMDTKIGSTITGKPKRPRRTPRKGITLPQHSGHQLRGNPTRTNSIPQSIRIQV